MKTFESELEHELNLFIDYYEVGLKEYPLILEDVKISIKSLIAKYAPKEPEYLTNIEDSYSDIGSAWYGGFRHYKTGLFRDMGIK